MKKEIKNTEASIRARLLNYAKKESMTFERVLLYYFQERFLYRLSISKYKESLVLKGGALLLALDMTKGRPTKDIDFLAMIPKLSHNTAVTLIREIVTMPADDAVVFDPTSVAAHNIREEDDLNALRIKCMALLGSAKGPLQIDIGYGDTAFPEPIYFQYPTILEQPQPELKAYSWETVIAEKFEAAVSLHFINSRLKDFYDILYLASSQAFDGTTLQSAIIETFKKRDLPLTETPVVFTEKFMQDKTKQVQWKAFLKRINVEGMTGDFSIVMDSIKKFLGPLADAIVNGRALNQQWDPSAFMWRPQRY